MTSLQAAPTAPADAVPPAPAEPRPARRWKGNPVRSVLKHIGLVIVAGAMIYPVLWMIVSSVRPNELIFRQPGLWLSELHLENYSEGWNALAYPFSRYLMNSTIVVAGSILGNLISCSLAAYAFARLKFRLRKVWFSIMLVTIMLPFHVVVVPQYILFSKMDWVNTFWPLLVPKLLATDAFFVFLMVQFIRGIPTQLDEAARLDGCGHGRIFFHVILPLMVPALATTAIFTFIWTWNDFFTALIYLTAPDMYTIPIALRSFIDATSGSNWGAMFAMSVVSLLPVFLAFLFGQKFLIKGMATTGLK